MLWFLSFIALFEGIRLLLPELSFLSSWIGPGRDREAMMRVSATLQELEEILATGLVPDAEKWRALGELPPPWGALAHDSVQMLRKSGGAVIPTLRRIRALADENRAALIEARARSAQALAQALICCAMVPLFGSALYLLLPGLADRTWTWVISCALAFLLGLLGARWMLKTALQARWGGLPEEKRSWVLACQCTGERVLALIRSGTPGDLAWFRAMELLFSENAALARLWGSDLWREGDDQTAQMDFIANLGRSVRRSIQISLMEGRPCTDRIETALAAFRAEFRARVDRELGLLATRSLKPLFLCVAPALFGLLAVALYFSWETLV